MPAKRPVKTTEKKPKEKSLSDSESDEITMESIPMPTTPIQNSSIYLTNSSSKNTPESDRIQLAHAINNFTIKSEQLIQEMKNFDSFKENVFKLDILMDSKKKEYDQINNNLANDHATRKKALEDQHTELSKKLQSNFDESVKKFDSDHKDKIKKCEIEFADKRKQLSNLYEDESIQMKRKLEADKSKACMDYAKDSGMRFIKEEDHKILVDNVQKAVHDYTELKKTFDKQCSQIREEEKVKYQTSLATEKLTMDLTHKATNAQIVAQVEQHKNEIKLLNDTLDNLKSELREQRELTKQVAQASSKAPITQSFGKN